MLKQTKRIPALLVFAGAALSSQADAGLLAHYKLDGDATDSAGSNDLTAYNNGVSADPTITGAGGAAGGYASFDGGNLLNTTFVPVTGNDSRTLSMWVRTSADNSASTGATTTFFAGWGGTDATAVNRYDLGLEATKNDQFRNEFNAGAVTSSTGTAINDGTWRHVAVTWDGSAVTFYLDGAAYGTTNRAAINTASVIGITLGADTRAGGVLSGTTTQTPNRFFVGDIDDVQVYDTALQATDIQTLFANPGTAIPEPGSLGLLALGGLACLRRRRRD